VTEHSDWGVSPRATARDWLIAGREARPARPMDAKRYVCAVRQLDPQLADVHPDRLAVGLHYCSPRRFAELANDWLGYWQRNQERPYAPESCYNAASAAMWEAFWAGLPTITPAAAAILGRPNPMAHRRRWAGAASPRRIRAAIRLGRIRTEGPGVPGPLFGLSTAELRRLSRLGAAFLSAAIGAGALRRQGSRIDWDELSRWERAVWRPLLQLRLQLQELRLPARLWPEVVARWHGDLPDVAIWQKGWAYRSPVRVIEGLADDLADSDAAIADANARINRADRDRARFRSRAADEEISDLQAQIANLQAQVANLQARLQIASSSQIVRPLLQPSREQRCEGSVEERIAALEMAESKRSAIEWAAEAAYDRRLEMGGEPVVYQHDDACLRIAYLERDADSEAAARLRAAEEERLKAEAAEAAEAEEQKLAASLATRFNGLRAYPHSGRRERMLAELVAEMDRHHAAGRPIKGVVDHRGHSRDELRAIGEQA